MNHTSVHPAVRAGFFVFVTLALACPLFTTAAHAQFGKSVVLIEGVVLDEATLKPIGASIEIYDPATNQKVNSYKSNSTSGAFSIVVKPSQHFTFRISAKGYFTSEEDVRTPSSDKYEHITRDFSLKASATGAEIPIAGRIFDFKKATLNVGADEVLSDILRMLTLNTDAKIAIVSYPDQTGDAAKNMEITQARSAAVKSYFTAHGVDGARIQTSGNSAPDPSVKSNNRRHAKGKHPVGKIYIRVA